jgi:hypothetical protein
MSNSPARFGTLPARSNGKHPGGRPTKRTPTLVARIAEAISSGLSDEFVAALVGIDAPTLSEWRHDREFSEAIKSAEAARLQKRLARIEAGEPGWQGTAWFLERRYPREFSRPELQFNQQINFDAGKDLKPTFLQVRVITIPDAEFEQISGKPDYSLLEDGSLERLEGSLRILVVRQSRSGNLLPQ